MTAVATPSRAATRVNRLFLEVDVENTAARALYASFGFEQVGDVFMDEGMVVESGAPREVLANPQHPRTQAFLAKVL